MTWVLGLSGHLDSEEAEKALFEEILGFVHRLGSDVGMFNSTFSGSFTKSVTNFHVPDEEVSDGGE